MKKSLWICVLACGCSTSDPSRTKVEWVDFVGEQKAWPLVLKASVDRPSKGVPVYRTAPVHPYDIIGSIRTAAGAGAASRLAREHGADALLWEIQSQRSSALRSATNSTLAGEEIFRAIRFTQTATLRQIQGHQAALDWLQQHPDGGTIDSGAGATTIEASQVATLRETWSAELARLRLFASTNVWGPSAVK